jgi:hypothetical protein
MGSDASEEVCKETADFYVLNKVIKVLCVCEYASKEYLQCQQIASQGLWSTAVELSEQLSTRYQSAQDLGERSSSFPLI